jgi:hypothetical protein
MVVWYGMKSCAAVLAGDGGVVKATGLEEAEERAFAEEERGNESWNPWREDERR